MRKFGIQQGNLPEKWTASGQDPGMSQSQLRKLKRQSFYYKNSIRNFARPNRVELDLKKLYD